MAGGECISGQATDTSRNGRRGRFVGLPAGQYAHVGKRRVGLTTQKERTFAASPAEVPVIRHWIEELAEESSFSQVRSDLAIAVSEAASNAIRHSGTHRLTVRWTAEGRKAAVEVKDEGVYSRESVSPDGIGGYGLPMMAALVDEFSIEQGDASRPGTRVRLVKRKP
jgi:anti-sigma regulatory factor (Ser/Thr protein kinase)